MQHFICQTCGTQYPESDNPPALCPICSDDRQYIGYSGQTWTTMAELHRKGFRNAFYDHEPGLIGIGTVPGFAIGQRALLVRTPRGNVLWDCISLLDDVTVALIRGLGGIDAIAISHPHFYSSMNDWAEAFNAPIYLHESNRPWVMRPNDHVHYWSGDDFTITDDIRLYRLGGHFEGGTVLLWQNPADHQGVLLSGDIIQVVADRSWVSFMYSYPNIIPLPANVVARIRDSVSTLAFDRLYGAWQDTIVKEHARESVIRSANRYIDAITD